MPNGVWVPCYDSIREHYKTYSLANDLGITTYAAIGIVMSVSVWACDVAEDGNIGRHPNKAIARAVGWEGDPAELVDALVRSGFLDWDEETLTIHNYKDYNGRLVAQREKARERKRAQRERDKEDM